MARFFLPPECWGGAPALTGDEAKHAAQVMRLRRGDRITVFDGAGHSASAEIQDVSKSEVRLALGETVERPPLRPRIHLAQAVPKGKTMDLIVQKAVELGVHSIQPLITRRTVVQVDADDADRKSSKWQRVALEACKQCGQDLLPVVEPARSFAEWLPQSGGGLRVIASLFPGARPLREVLRSVESPEDVILLVGPEGDFTPEEGKSAIEGGFQPASLGEIILRAETAAFFGISAIRYEY
ncbi:16S rRNA (uracil(1498)-N(3))-methyltransferase [Luteolibacter flavescens]|uniref:Ribosomal RNA small subunit methyltransferase E n=1 Tax=Luteolibacter flavescens TaxID=1859460 RepID=A0ABT3FLP8_9BACT|nr:16S rRNA (uracil(1498)-N(3))-methyltransferase [Luteolibacter flavescens]MCW1884377.1 16S rRNA (uracil(1498)-N(3))-methyltransferase [Luteolibacter flavescens]